MKYRKYSREEKEAITAEWQEAVSSPVIIYRYYPTRGAPNIQDFITGYSGFLQTDGYEAYNTALSEHAKTNPEDHITHVGCLAHARRKFFDATKVSSSKSKTGAYNCISWLFRSDA
jgi:transposase